MKRIHKLVTLSLIALLCTNSGYSQYEGFDDGAYQESQSSNLSAYLPIGALIVAGGLLILTANRGHHHHTTTTTTTTTHAH